MRKKKQKPKRMNKREAVISALRAENSRLKRENQQLRDQRHGVAVAIRSLLNASHDDETDEVPF